MYNLWNIILWFLNFYTENKIIFKTTHVIICFATDAKQSILQSILLFFISWFDVQSPSLAAILRFKPLPLWQQLRKCSMNRTQHQPHASAAPWRTLHAGVHLYCSKTGVQVDHSPLKLLKKEIDMKVQLIFKQKYLIILLNFMKKGQCWVICSRIYLD